MTVLWQHQGFKENVYSLHCDRNLNAERTSNRLWIALVTFQVHKWKWKALKLITDYITKDQMVQ